MFTTESEFEKPLRQKRKNEMWEIKINRDEIKEMKKLDEEKAIEPDGVSGYILKQ